MRGLPRRGALARAPVGRRPLFGRGASRRRKRGRRQRQRAMVAMGDSLPSRMGGDQTAGLVASE